MKKLLFIFAVLTLVGCNKEVKPSFNEEEALICSCPPVVWLQPCNSFTKAEAQKLAPVIEKAIEENTGMEYYVDVRDRIDLSKDLYNKAGTRYRGTKILDFLQSTFDNSHDGVIALVHEDISATKGDIEDWGVQGLSYMGKKVSVVSDFRVKDKSQLWKVILHEFLHSFRGLDHCEKNNPSCILKEGAMRKSEIKLCDDCKRKMY